MSAPVIHCENLEVCLGRRQVLSGVTLDVAKGEFLGLLGPNGAGKTTFLRTLLGLLPYRGVAHIQGKQPRAHKGRIGYVPQRHEFSWDFPITVEGVVLTGRMVSKKYGGRTGVEDFRAVHQALSQVELANLANRPVGELSGGQRQRVLVARALVVQSPILLLDEPFTGVDMPTVELLTALFAQLAQAGHCVVMSTHDLPAAMDSCTSLGLLREKIHAVGTPGTLRNPHIWMDTFEVSATSPLLRSIGISRGEA